MRDKRIRQDSDGGSTRRCALFNGSAPASSTGLMSHTDRDHCACPQGFTVTAAHTSLLPRTPPWHATARKLYAVQFHPEVESTPNRHGRSSATSSMSVCGAAGDYNLEGYLEKQLIEDPCASRSGSAHVLLALSGGVDSSVAARRCSAKAVPGQAHLHLRRPRPDAQERGRARWSAPSAGAGSHFVRVDARERFLSPSFRR